jgi:hypothetical protein
METQQANPAMFSLESPLYLHDYRLGTQRAVGYKLGKLPPNEKVRIAFLDHRWKYFRTSNGVAGPWTGKFLSETDALRAVESVFRAEQGC